MGIFTKTTIKGKIGFDDEIGEGYFSGNDLDGNSVLVKLTGSREIRDTNGNVVSKAKRFNKESFLKDMSEIIELSSRQAIKQNPSKAHEINENKNSRLSTLQNLEKKDITLLIEQANGVYSPDIDKFILTTSALAVKLDEKRKFYPVKLVETNKNLKQTIPMEIEASAMVINRTGFAVYQSENKEIKYEKDSPFWKRKVVTAGDIDSDRVDYSTVKLKGTLLKGVDGDAVDDIYEKNIAYLSYMSENSEKTFIPSFKNIANEERGQYFAPKVHLRLVDSEITSVLGGKKNVVEEILQLANNIDENFHFELIVDGKQIQVNSESIKGIDDKKIIGALFEKVVNDLGGYSKIVDGFIKKGKENITKDDLALAKRVDSFKRMVDKLYNSSNIMEYGEQFKKIMTKVKNQKLSNVPLEISTPLSTETFSLKDDPKYEQARSSVLKNLLTKMAKDVVTPIERVYSKYMLSNSESQYIKDIAKNISERVDIRRDDKGRVSINYKQNEYGSTMKDFVKLKVYGEVRTDKGFHRNNEFINAIGYSAVRVNKSDPSKSYIGMSGIGGRDFTIDNKKYFAGVGISYIQKPISKSSVIKVNGSKKLKRNILFKDADVQVASSDEEKTQEQNVLTENTNTKQTEDIPIVGDVKEEQKQPETPHVQEPQVQEMQEPKQEEPKQEEPKQESDNKASLPSIFDEDSEELETKNENITVAEVDQKIIEEEENIINDFGIDDSMLDDFLEDIDTNYNQEMSTEDMNRVKQSASSVAPM